MPAIAEPLPTAEGRAVAISAVPVAIPAEATAPSVAVLGAAVLTADDPGFGGFSGLVIEGERLTAVTDRGQWLTAQLGLDADGVPQFSGARMAAMTDAAGRPLTGMVADAEALAVSGGALHVAFERRHRVMRHLGGGRLGETLRDPRFDALPFNAGMEALAALPDGRLLAIGEEGEGFPAFLIGDGLSDARLARRSKHAVTGADLGPDGKLYLVRRHFSRLTGVSIRVTRHGLSAEGGFPDLALGETLAAFESGSGIDNMEAIAVTPAPDGRLWIWLLADDNFNAVQRTVMVVLRADPA